MMIQECFIVSLLDSMVFSLKVVKIDLFHVKTSRRGDSWAVEAPSTLPDIRQEPYR
jgi:hypothetical protein